MVWALLAILGVPIWLIVGALAVLLFNRRRIKRLPGTFACKLRPLNADASPGGKFSRVGSVGCWAHDVLAVQQGLGLVRTRLLPAASVEGPTPVAADTIKGLGESVLSIIVTLDDGSKVEVAGNAAASALLVGPPQIEIVATPSPTG
jgi:hypothetical protein